MGSWDLLRTWSGLPGERVEPRLALHLVNEAALCLCSYRQQRTLSQKGFELANGLPFVPADRAIHELLDAHTVEQAQHLQLELGKLRRASHHFAGQLLALDPHRMLSFTQRQMRRHRFSSQEKPAKMAQIFFLLDCASRQPICCLLRSAASCVAQASPALLDLAAQILGHEPGAPGDKPLVLCDKEHYTEEFFEAVRHRQVFDLLCALPAYPNCRERWRRLPASAFTERWPGYATAVVPYHFASAASASYYEYVQRTGRPAGPCEYQGFLGTAQRDPAPALTRDYPERWTVEPFFKLNQTMRWQRAGTLNLNIRYGQLTLALVAQAALHQLRQRWGEPFRQWDALHLARNFFEGIEGDIRVEHQTIIVTLYQPPHVDCLREHYEHLPQKLAREGVNPAIPWLYNFKLDFRFK